MKRYSKIVKKESARAAERYSDFWLGTDGTAWVDVNFEKLSLKIGIYNSTAINLPL
jgi:hypothetical protein